MSPTHPQVHAAFAGYTIRRELGRGGMATVYLADDPKHHRSVALKVLRSGAAAGSGAARFLREVEIAANLTHPNILSVYDSGEADGLPFYVMPYVEGGSLRDKLERDGPLPIAEAVRIAGEVAEALGHAHEHGIVHRDVKPENILFEGGQPVVTDFGVARAVLAAGERLTEEGVVVGTPAYMSPEQVSGQSDVDPRADQYALACVLYEMLAGQPPFTGATSRAVQARHVVDPVPPLATVRPGVPGPVRRALLRALAKAPADRFPNVRAFAGALTAPDAGDEERGSSVAVLPFANLSGVAAEDAYFADGIAEEIINALTKIDGLRVASRTSSFAFKGRSMDVRAIGELLDVRAVLEGSVRRSGDTLRITAQLVNTTDGYHLWSERYDRRRRDVFAIQDEIATNIARALRVVLRDDERRQARRRQPADLEAYDLYLRGRQFFHQGRKRSLAFARQLFEQAIERDPAYARAYAGLADACAFLAHYYQDETHARNLEGADEASRKALELDPDLAEAHATRGFVLWLLDRFPEAEREFRRAIELDPRQFEARYYYGRASFQRGDLERAAELFEEASGAREDHEAAYFAAQTVSALGRAVDAAAAYRRALPLIERHLTLNPDDARAITLGAVAFSRLGDRERGIEWAERALAADPSDAGVCYNVACLFALVGEHDRAIDSLKCAFGVGFAHRDWIEHDPDLESLRGDPRFQTLLQGR